MSAACKKDVLVIGGGFFGMYIADYLARKGKKVVLCEKESDFMQRASYANQARIHNGYHYPRSILTAFRSRVSFPRFVKEFPDAIHSSFKNYYMVGKVLSNITAKQFERFCHRIGAYCESSPQSITKLVNPQLVEHVFSTIEYVFDATILKKTMLSRLQESNVELLLNSEIKSICNSPTGGLEATVGHHKEKLHVKQIFNCTYSMLNCVLVKSNLKQIPLKHEMIEMCLIDVPDELKDKGITIMCGPFFSVMPFPSRGLHTLSHVRYTPHYEWHDDPSKEYLNALEHHQSVTKRSEWRKMKNDIQRYLPLFSESQCRDSIWEVKTVLPRSETDDSRPILFKSNYGFKGLHCILGGKIDNIYDAIEMIKSKGLDQ